MIPQRSSKTKRTLLVLGLAVLLGGLFLLGWVPRQRRAAGTVEAARAVETAVPLVRVAQAKRGADDNALLLPGNIQGVAETPIYARAEGYIVKRNVDIGDRVRKGQVLVEIDAPEVDEQVRSAEARLAQGNAALQLSKANREQAAANLALAQSTNKRWQGLVQKGILSKQEGEERQTTSAARQADLNASEAGIVAAQQDIHALEGELGRLRRLQQFVKVTAPFEGIITQRNCDVGNLITPSAIASGRELFQLADARTLRVFVSVPEAYVPSIRVGQKAQVQVQEFSGRTFPGIISRTASALNQETRTLLTEVQVQNQNGPLLPGMYAQVSFGAASDRDVLQVPGDTLISRRDGTFVAIVGPDRKVRHQKVQVGRDYGTSVEILSGLQGGESLVINPSDAVQVGQVVRTR